MPPAPRNKTHTFAMVPMILSLCCIVAAGFCVWVDIYDNGFIHLGPVYRVKVALTWISVFYPQGQDLQKAIEIGAMFAVGSNPRTALMDDFNGVESWSAFENQACGLRVKQGDGMLDHMGRHFIRHALTGDICDPAKWIHILAMFTTVTLCVAGLFGMTAVVQFFTGAIMKRSKSHVFPACTMVLLVFVQGSALAIGFLIFNMFDCERMFFPSWGFLNAFVGMMAAGISVCLALTTAEDDMDFEEFLEDKEEQEYLMRYNQQYQMQAPMQAPMHAPAPPPQHTVREVYVVSGPPPGPGRGHSPPPGPFDNRGYSTALPRTVTAGRPVYHGNPYR